jgi:hypothetical protein
MTWRVGRKVPINIYEGDRAVCQCHTPEDAYRIVKAMNASEEAQAEMKPGHFLDDEEESNP